MRTLELLKKAQDILIDIPSKIDDSYCLLGNVLNCDRAKLLTNFEVEKTFEDKFLSMINLKLKNIPLQKIIGYTEFYGLKVKYNDNTLTPRLETEILVDLILKENDVKNNYKLLDLCCGSGCIGIAIAKNSNFDVTLSDVSEFATYHSMQTAKNNGVKVKIVKSNMFENIKEKFDIIVSNPPYIKTIELKQLEKEVINFDPIISLDGGIDGMKFYTIIYNDVDKYINKNGKLYLEIHHDLGIAIKEMFEKKFNNVKIIKDYNNLDRFIEASELKR